MPRVLRKNEKISCPFVASLDAAVRVCSLCFPKSEPMSDPSGEMQKPADSTPKLLLDETISDPHKL